MKIEKLLRAIELTVRKAVREELTSIKQPLVISNTRGHKTINTKQATTESRLNSLRSIISSDDLHKFMDDDSETSDPVNIKSITEVQKVISTNESDIKSEDQDEFTAPAPKALIRELTGGKNYRDLLAKADKFAEGVRQ